MRTEVVGSSAKKDISAFIGEDGNIHITIHTSNGGIALLLVTKNDFQPYRLYRKDDHFEAISLLDTAVVQHNPRT